MQYPMSPNAQSMEQGADGARRNQWLFEQMQGFMMNARNRQRQLTMDHEVGGK
jgi:hypothetical protein